MNTAFKTMLLFLAVTGVTEVNAKVLRYAVLDYCPYICNHESTGKDGIVLEIHKRIFEQADYDIKVTFLPWPRVVYGLESGQYDATPFVNAHHSKVIVLSEENPIILKQKFYVRQDNDWHYEGISSLDGLYIGNVIGYNYEGINPDYQAYIDENESSPRIQFTSGLDAQERNVKKLLAGRIDTYNEDVGFMFQLAQKLGIEGQIKEAGLLGTNPTFAGFSPKHPDAHVLVDIFDEGMRKLRASGELNQMLAKYVVVQ